MCRRNWRCVVLSSCGGAPTWAMLRPGCRSRGEGLVLLRRWKALRLSLRDFGGSRDAFLSLSLSLSISVARRTNCKKLLRNQMASYRTRRCDRLCSSALTLRRHRFYSPTRRLLPCRPSSFLLVRTKLKPPLPPFSRTDLDNTTHPEEQYTFKRTTQPNEYKSAMEAYYYFNYSTSRRTSFLSDRS